MHVHQTQKAAKPRQMPWSEESEQALLGCALLDPQSVMNACIEAFRDGGNVFYDLKHKLIYELLAGMHAKGEPIEVMTVMQRLKDRGELEQIGGIAYLSGLPDSVASAANAGFYIALLLEKHTARQLITVCTGIAARAYESEDINEDVQQAEREVLQINAARKSDKPTHIKPAIHASINEIEEIHENQGKQRKGLRTGFVDFDRLKQGMRGGQMMLLGGKTGEGKTSLALNIADHIAVVQKVAVGIFSLEMGSEELAMRLLCARSRFDVNRAAVDGINQLDFTRIAAAAGALANAPIHIVDSSDLSINELRAKGRRLWQEHQIGFWIVDYLQLVSAGKKTDRREEEVSSVAQGLKAMAKETNAPLLVLSQLNDDGAIRESRGPGHHADLVGKLFAEDPWPNSGVVKFNLKVQKHRGGPKGTVELRFFQEFTRFESATNADEPMI